MAFALRVKTKTGQQLIKNLTPSNTIKDLKIELASVSSIPEERLHVLAGYPPKIFDLSNDSLPLSQSGLASGDTLILEEKAEAARSRAPLESVESQVVPSARGILLKKVVPADNSCLFSSIFFVLNGKIDESGGSAPWMRELCAQTVQNDPETYNEAVLGKPNGEYGVWIQDDKSWGGAIELAILSQHYGLEIAVVDTINAIINRFGEDQHYPLRVFLLFDGIHYDPLYLEPLDGGKPQTMFPTDDDEVMAEAQQLAKEANSSRQFTDVDKFTLKCMICNIFLNGQVQAREHAQSTGHTDFGEVMK